MATLGTKGSTNSDTKAAKARSDRLGRQLLRTSVLCRTCLKRQGVRAGFTSAAKMKSKECQICKGLIERLPSLTRDVQKKIAHYEFETFLVGANLPQEILNREDELRSRFKIRGLEGIKTQISRTIGRGISKATGKRVDYSHPDLTLLISLGEGTVSIFPRSIWISAKYRKYKRGIPQRSSICMVCNGLGCAQCNYKGANQSSVQSLVEQFFSRTLKAECCSFIWIGSEDEKSLVNGEGRPFYAEIQKPRKRHFQNVIRRKSIDLDGIVLSTIEVLDSKPTSIPQFKIKCVAYLSAKQGLDEAKTNYQGGEIESRFRNATVNIRNTRKGKILTKKIFSILAKKDEKFNHPLSLEIECEGGIPIKKLILGGDDFVYPNLSSYVEGLTLDQDMPFDVENVFLNEPRAHRAERRKNSLKRRAYPRDKEIREEIEELELV